MNTVKSTWLGWGVLCVAGGGAYYFAKRSINSDRAARFDADRKKQARLRDLEARSGAFSEASAKTKIKGNASTNKGTDHAGSPSSEISEDAAAVSHAPVTAEQRTREKSKYEAAEPFRSKKGDRFS